MTGKLLADPRIIVIMVSLALPTSLFYGFIDERTKSIVPSWIVHALALTVSTMSGSTINISTL